MVLAVYTILIVILMVSYNNTMHYAKESRYHVVYILFMRVIRLVTLEILSSLASEKVSTFVCPIRIREFIVKPPCKKGIVIFSFITYYSPLSNLCLLGLGTYDTVDSVGRICPWKIS